MFLFNFVLYCTFSMTVPFYCQVFISTWRCCWKVQLGQKKGGRRIWTEGCQSQGAEELMEWNCVQHQSRIYSMTKNVMPLQSRQQLSVYSSHKHKHTKGIQTPLCAPNKGIPFMFSSPNPRRTIRFHGRIFTPKQKHMTMPIMAKYPKIFTFSLSCSNDLQRHEKCFISTQE